MGLKLEDVLCGLFALIVTGFIVYMIGWGAWSLIKSLLFEGGESAFKYAWQKWLVISFFVIGFVIAIASGDRPIIDSGGGSGQKYKSGYDDSAGT